MRQCSPFDNSESYSFRRIGSDFATIPYITLKKLGVVPLNMVSLNIDAPARLPSEKILMQNTLISASALILMDSCTDDAAHVGVEPDLVKLASKSFLRICQRNRE